MTLHMRRATLLVAFYLLTSAATAYAECAWVMWSEAIGPQPGLSIILAYAMQQDCEASVRAAYRKIGAPNAVPGGFVQVNDGQMRVRFVCLPDTLDPRGPKGK